MTMIIFMNARPGVVEEVVIAMITRATAERAVIGIVIDAVDEMTMTITTDQTLAQETQIWLRLILVARPRIVFGKWFARLSVRDTQRSETSIPKRML
jgi:hypothetical protein